jgi:ABC-2 type transport system permease protein
MFNLIGRQITRHRAFLIATSVVLGGFQFLFCAIVAGIDVNGLMNQVLAFAPPIIRAMTEQAMGGGTKAGMLAFGWNHPVTHALLIALPITFGARAIAGEIEAGVIELVLAQPLSRVRYLLAHVTFAVFSMLAIGFAGVIGAVAGQGAIALDLFRWNRFLELLLNVLLLQLAIYSITLFFSAFGREAGRVASLGVLIAIVSFLLNAVATLWTKAAFLKPYSLHSYYDPRPVLVDGHLAPASLMVLGAVALAGTTGAFARFLSRDLP